MPQIEAAPEEQPIEAVPEEAAPEAAAPVPEEALPEATDGVQDPEAIIPDLAPQQ